jgi:cell shape-determining protein MreC
MKNKKIIIAMVIAILVAIAIIFFTKNVSHRTGG